MVKKRWGVGEKGAPAVENGLALSLNFFLGLFFLGVSGCCPCYSCLPDRRFFYLCKRLFTDGIVLFNLICFVAVAKRGRAVFCRPPLFFLLTADDYLHHPIIMAKKAKIIIANSIKPRKSKPSRFISLIHDTIGAATNISINTTAIAITF